MSQFIDLSHLIEDGMITYNGLPGPVISDHMSREDSESHYSDGTTFQIGTLKMVANTGTYIDAYFENHPFLTRDAAEYLKSSGAALVGIDSLNIDDTADGSRPAHSILLKAEIPIVEHMCHLDILPGKGFKFFAVPAPVQGMGSFPVRAFALID